MNQIVDTDVPASEVAADPFNSVGDLPNLAKAPELFTPERRNSTGFDLTHIPTLQQIEQTRSPHQNATWHATALTSSGKKYPRRRHPTSQPIANPANPHDAVGQVAPATPDDIAAALSVASPWTASPACRAAALNATADAYEANAGEIFPILAREAGKGLPDAVAELREAVDFLRYYAAQIDPSATPRGVWTCISPWNFPLAIFTGQIAAALAAGNAVLAKPAEQTPLIAHFAITLMRQAGVPDTAIQLLPGDGMVGAALTSDARISGVAFTGSTATARKIASAMADHCAPGTPLIAETGGLNAMIVDSTALPEHAVRDIVMASFRSAGQRCSALRCLYVQDDVAPKLLKMLKGAMDALTVGDPWHLSTDVGPVIDKTAHQGIADHIAQASADGRIIHQIPVPSTGHFIAPTVIRVDGIADLTREIFGPVLHVATFKSHELDNVIADINATGYGLTFGLHTRIDDRVEALTTQVHAGNIYVNRDQIGAVVGSQPFGGEGLSGTGPKAGGPLYQPRFTAPKSALTSTAPEKAADLTYLTQKLLAPYDQTPLRTMDLPGPTGESNRLHALPRGPILCLGPDARAQADAVKTLGGHAVIADGHVPATALKTLPCAAVIWWGDAETARVYAQALAQREGPITALITTYPDAAHVLHERHVCIDTTAAGGNAALLAELA